MPSYVTITPKGITVVGNLMKAKGRRVKAELPFKKTFRVAASDRMMQERSDCEPRIICHDLTWVEVNMEKGQVLFGTEHEGAWAWNGAPEYIRFRAKGPIEEVIVSLGGKISDLTLL